MFTMSCTSGVVVVWFADWLMDLGFGVRHVRNRNVGVEG